MVHANTAKTYLVTMKGWCRYNNDHTEETLKTFTVVTDDLGRWYANREWQSVIGGWPDYAMLMAIEVPE